jgi:hypothetical protein
MAEKLIFEDAELDEGAPAELLSPPLTVAALDAVFLEVSGVDVADAVEAPLEGPPRAGKSAPLGTRCAGVFFIEAAAPLL